MRGGSIVSFEVYVLNDINDVMNGSSYGIVMSQY